MVKQVTIAIQCPNASFSTSVDLPQITCTYQLCNSQKFHQHVSLATSKAMHMVEVIQKTICSIPIDTFLSLYNTVNTLVRPHLEYSNVIWGSFYTLDQNRIKNVQRAATRLVPSIKHLTYDQRLQELKLPTLKHRRQWGDMICVYSLFNNIYDLDYSLFFTLAHCSYRGSPTQTFQATVIARCKGSCL